jgi:hypothetical protein
MPAGSLHPPSGSLSHSIGFRFLDHLTDTGGLGSRMVLLPKGSNKEACPTLLTISRIALQSLYELRP